MEFKPLNSPARSMNGDDDKGQGTYSINNRKADNHDFKNFVS